jgi:hypothetical protein
VQRSVPAGLKVGADLRAATYSAGYRRPEAGSHSLYFGREWAQG